MRIETTSRELYKFDELSAEAQDKAIEKLYDLNVDYEWWYSTYDDAANIGIKITSFDLDRNRNATGKFIDYALDTAEAIIREHGQHCETYKTAEAYIKERNDLIATEAAEWNAEAENDDAHTPFDERDVDTDDIDMDFLKSILEDYSIMLQHEYEYLTSAEAIKETILANEYEFDENGGMA
jgi:hypothetical protein